MVLFPQFSLSTRDLVGLLFWCCPLFQIWQGTECAWLSYWKCWLPFPSLKWPLDTEELQILV